MDTVTKQEEDQGKDYFYLNYQRSLKKVPRRFQSESDLKEEVVKQFQLEGKVAHVPHCTSKG